MGQQSDGDLWPFKLLVDLITKANYVFPVFLAIRRIGGFIVCRLFSIMPRSCA